MNPYEKPDFYSKKAKEEGYVARSIYKLKEIQDKFKLIKLNQKILDLGCAPGSWSQYTAKLVGDNGLVIGIDYKPIKVNLNNTKFITGDFLTEENKTLLKEYSPFNGIISDMAPDTVGDRLADCFNSSNLVKEALVFSYNFLRKGGFFIAKIFQGGDEKEIILQMKEAFNEVKCFKPVSSRKSSFEIFLIGINYLKKPEINNKDFSFDENTTGEMMW